MTWSRPTLRALVAQARADIDGELGNGAAFLRNSLESAMAYMGGGMTHHLHGHLATNARQALPDTCDEDQFVRWANLFGLARKSATFAGGPITGTGTGGLLPIGREFSRSPDGAIYTVDAEVSDVTGAVTAYVTAAVAGAAGNLDPGAVLTLVSPITGVASEWTVTSDADHTGLDGGAEVETFARWVARLVERLRRAPRGGGPGDHRAWALEVAGVTRAWEYRHKDYPASVGVGECLVYFVVDDDVDGLIPDAGQVAAVQSYLDGRSPLKCTAVAPTAVPYAFAVSVTGGTAAAVNAEVEDMLLRVAEPGGTIPISSLSEAISASEGETAHVIGSPVTDKPHAFGSMATYVAGTVA